MKLRAFDLSQRTTRAGRASLERRVDRLRNRTFLIVQIAVTAGIAWFLASGVLHHAAPFFAPIAAIVCLGGTYGHRLRRGVEIAIGVALGIAVGGAFVHMFGKGVWQVVLVVGLAMALATLVGAGQLMITQAGVQAIVVTILVPDATQAFDRWLDAVIGCVIALIVATVAPGSPLRQPRQLASQSLRELAQTLEAAVDALQSGSEDAADQVLERARATEHELEILAEATSEGLAVVRHSPFRRKRLGELQAYADLYDPLDRANRNLRVLARRCVTVVWREQTVPPGYLGLLNQVAEVARFMSIELSNGRLPTAARSRLSAVGESSSQLPVAETISAVVIFAQARSILVDLLELTGLDHADARELIPEVD